MEGGGGKGSFKGAGIRSPGGDQEETPGEESGDEVNDESVTGAVEAKGITEEVASSRVSAVVLLHTSQKGSGHNSC